MRMSKTITRLILEGLQGLQGLQSWCANKNGKLTVSNPRPLNTRSVVAATIPPFLCRSHAISLLFNCGNMLAIWSMCAGLIRTARFVPAGRVPAAAGFARYHRMARTETMMKTMSCGMLSVCSAMVGDV